VRPCKPLLPSETADGDRDNNDGGGGGVFSFVFVWLLFVVLLDSNQAKPSFC
jgi:hypothetical protein